MHQIDVEDGSLQTAIHLEYRQPLFGLSKNVLVEQYFLCVRHKSDFFLPSILQVYTYCHGDAPDYNAQFLRGSRNIMGYRYPIHFQLFYLYELSRYLYLHFYHKDNNDERTTRASLLYRLLKIQVVEAYTLLSRFNI